MTSHYVDLELSLSPVIPGRYSLAMSLETSEDDLRRRFDPDEPVFVVLDEAFDEALRGALPDMERYGQLLTDRLFPDEPSRRYFHDALDRATALEVPLRCCLTIPRSARALDRYFWETLREPPDSRRPSAPGRPLAVRRDIVFFRFLSAKVERSTHPRSGQLTALVVIADGRDRYAPNGVPLAPIQRDDELERARAGLAGMKLVELVAPGEANLAAIEDALHKGVDLVYLVCHGAIVRDEPVLFLEDAQGATDAVLGGRLVEIVQKLLVQPQLIVLASCQSAGDGAHRRSADGGALAGLGPKLAAAGVPAVVAMQGNITMTTAALFMPRLFTAFREHSSAIDLAVSIARSSVAHRPDWHIPVLFTRLRLGRPWLPDSTQAFGGWGALLGDIEAGHCTPLLGFDLLERTIGSASALANDWAQQHHLPLGDLDRGELHRVAQYIADDQTPSFLRTLLSDRFQAAPSQPAGDPHAILARLPFRTYIVATPDDLLLTALTEAGKSPQPRACNWRAQAPVNPSSRIARDARGQPPEGEPLVCHLFGRLTDESTAPLLSEEDYFDFLLGFGAEETRRRQLPTEVMAALAGNGLLFLGFRLDDWSFRVLIHAIRRIAGSVRNTYTNVAVQIDPVARGAIAPERIKYFIHQHLQDLVVKIFWGTADQFVAELDRQWTARKTRMQPAPAARPHG